MSKVSVLNEKLEKASEIELPAKYAEVNSHNLYLYVKSYLASLRANTAQTKGRSEVSGGGKKPWRQKGRGGARAGSTRTNVWVGGAVAFGPTNNRNYEQKVNKKQKRLALEFAMNEKANEGKFYVFDNLSVESGKTKDAAKFIEKLGVRDALIVKNELDAQTLLAYRNLKNCYVVDASEVNAYLVAVYSSIVCEKAAFETLVKED
ncbi:50S ribosomal protein L4 [Campylobacter sp. JMF_01 NE2]|uniref:50S ribosomal protein L4 n=1 Tax=unclassified Campylobacter TaxID=2593542 RepID=UPI001B50E4E1|nr:MULTISPECIES: 50S ribosomal protein L4 [unclassified Campylobacter]MBP3224087.1 50S ribosomal protein L4 [Campylobacter sp.]MDA3043870.1 50S ribosomal protein L4 [Campylobacter sp. JMF_09 ED2]MDA3044019.1 50S ribosomal protein L4 [Campylobacter sp. JMF_07 ED4]MDA3045723.1 50S ribosomal protein L4 [Campylobacter sp. VBCF_06 NA8]MDA3047936.1 50S ribosomal protein L4 [Campylobacter sp. JMF_08 NE1]